MSIQPNNEEPNKIPWKLIGQVFLVVVAIMLIFAFGWQVKSISILGFEIEPPKTAIVQSVDTSAVPTISSLDNAQPIYPSEAPSGSNFQSTPSPLTLGELIFDENFDNNNNDWPNGINEDNYKVYLDGSEYHIVGDLNGTGMWFGVQPITNIGDFYLETKTRRLDDSQQSNDYGVLFRQSNLINYIFVINPDQQRYALLRVDMPTGRYTDLIHWVYSPRIATGFETNIIGILAKGESITIFINGHKIDSIQDDSSLTGAIGFVGGNGEHVAIDYLKIWALK